MFEQLGLIGCGLMGGSFALALKRAGLVRRVVGYSKSPSSAQRALELGVIDAIVPSALEAATGADIVLLAVPVSATEHTLHAIKNCITADTLIMDVGSTKRDVVEAALRGLEEKCGAFVPAHPIAGKESAGVEHAEAGLYDGRQVILTPITNTLPRQLQRAHEVWNAMGCHVKTMTPEQHDAAFAAVSHLPHLLAFAMMNGIAAQPEAEEFFKLAGPGFRDFTRIAASDPRIWTDIMLANRSELIAQSQRFQQSLMALEKAITAGDGEALEGLIHQASHTRAGWTLTTKTPA